MRLCDGLAFCKWPDELPGNEAKRKRSGLGGAKFPLFYGGIPVNGLLKLSSLIDGLTERVGKAIIWLVLVVTLIGAGNAVMRYYLELQFECLSRNPVVPLFGDLPFWRRLYADAQRACAHRPHFGPIVCAWAGLDRHLRNHLFPPADGHCHHVPVVADLSAGAWPTTNSRAMPAASRCGRYACWCRSVSSCW
jgi:hypothetical protein